MIFFCPQEFVFTVYYPIKNGEVLSVRLLRRTRWGTPRSMGVYLLGLDIVVKDFELAVTDSLVDDRNKPVPVST